jgi:hypothetical protein
MPVTESDITTKRAGGMYFPMDSSQWRVTSRIGSWRLAAQA